MWKQFWQDEAGFIISAELVLVATMLVIGLVVGLSKVQHAIIGELGDVADAIGSLDQTYSYRGFADRSARGAAKSSSRGSSFRDYADECDLSRCDLAGSAPLPAHPPNWRHSR